MKTAMALLCVLAWAADDAKPEGTWKWSVERNGEKVETTLKLKAEGDKLTGTITGRDGKESAIEEGSFKDGEVKFQVTRERDGNKIVIKYAGKLEGDTLKGTIERPGRDGGAPTKADWNATRAK